MNHRKGTANRNADAMSRMPEETAPLVSMVNTRSSTRNRSTTQSDQASTNPKSCDSMDDKVNENFILSNHHADIQYHQQHDMDIQRIIKYIKEHHHPTVREVRRQSPRLRRLLWQLPRFVLQNGLLYRRRQDNFGTSSLQVVVPESLIPRVLEEIHGNPSSGHFGVQRTLHRAEAMCYWPFMHKDITNYCRTCHACESIRSPNPKHQAPLQNIKTDHPLQIVFADIAELPTSRSGYHYILVVVDHFSKYTNIYPMRDQTAQTVARHLFEEYIKEHRVPESLHIDQGRQFESRLVQDLCKKLGIRKSRSSPYHPQGAGIVERANRVIKEQLKQIADQGGDWDKHIHQLQLAYNTSVHSSTGMTPYFVMHGREARTPASITCPIMTQSYDSPQEYVTDVCSRLRKAFQHAKQKTDQAQLRQKKDYDVLTRTIKYTPGDLVWLHDPINARHKLEPNWKGPFVIVSSSPDELDFKIADIHNENVKKLVHHNRLKLFRSKAYLQGKTSTSRPSSDSQKKDLSIRPPSSAQAKPEIPPSSHLASQSSIEMPWSAKSQTHADQVPIHPVENIQLPPQEPIHPERSETDRPSRSDSLSQSADQSIQPQRLDNSDPPSGSEKSKGQSTQSIQSSTQPMQSSTQSSNQHPMLDDSDQPPWSESMRQSSTQSLQQQANQSIQPLEPNQVNSHGRQVNSPDQSHIPGPSRENEGDNPEVTNREHPPRPSTDESVSQRVTCGREKIPLRRKFHTRSGRSIHKPKKYSDYQL
nr:uncharacterized protein LOC129267744 [Lytechinus pictus]